MGFNKVYKSLQDIFPEIDNRVLRAVALENRKDADAAAEVVLTKVIPHFIARYTHSTSSRNDKDAVQSPKVSELCHDVIHGEQDALLESATCLNEEERDQSFDAENGDELEVENSERICDHFVATPEALNPCLEKESNGPEGAACEPEPSIPLIIDDESTLNMGLNRSVHICYTDVIEDSIAVERNKKEAMLDKMQSVVNLMKEVEVEESAAEQAKKEAAFSGLEILKRVEELNGELQHAKEANDMHSGEVYGEKAILATEVKELQSRILSLSEQRDTSLGILDEMCQNLEGRLDAAKKEKEAAEKNILEKEDQAKKALAENQLVMEKVVQEANILKQLEEENSKLREFLVDRGHVVDILQGEISLVKEDVKLLKEKFDELLPLNKSLSFSQTTCNLAASSSSPKSMAPEQVEEAIVQADLSEAAAEKTNPLPYVADCQVIVQADPSESTTEKTNNPLPYVADYQVIVQADPSESTTEKTNPLSYVADYQVIVQADLSESRTEKTNNPLPYLVEPSPTHDDNKDMDDEWELCDI